MPKLLFKTGRGKGEKKHLIGILAFEREITHCQHNLTETDSSWNNDPSLQYSDISLLAKPSWKLSWSHLYRSEPWVLRWDGMMEMYRNENELKHT